MAREYRKAKRAEDQRETRERILRATMELHVAQGVATTSYADVAARAGVGAATVYRHFPTADSLVEACGARFLDAIGPPRAADADALFDGARDVTERLARLAEALDAFHARAEGPLWCAVRDADRVPQLADFLETVRAEVTGFTAAALGVDPGSETARTAAAILDFEVWRRLVLSGVPRDRIRSAWPAMVQAALSAPG
ncbi:TetR family transcriptional regulator [Rhodobacterales bacterium HKCCE2091]|nr:TetR family transcriptional regulator [Rhodobacterales bacterium HKCCE2091]